MPDLMGMILITTIAIITLLIVYILLDAWEKFNIKRLSKARLVKYDSKVLDKLIEELMKVQPIQALITFVSKKLSYFNTYSAASNYRHAFILILCTIATGAAVFLMLIINFGSVWYLSLLYMIVTGLMVYIIFGLYSDFRENSISRQIPEALNDLKVAYDSKKRIKQAILECYQDMPKDVRREFARLAEADNLADAIVFLKGRVKNKWFKIILSVMQLAVIKGDREGALSTQLQNLNSIISQEILISESARLLFQLYKLLILATPFLAIYLKNLNMDISSEIAMYYSTIEGMNSFALFLMLCIGAYFGLDLIERG